MVHYGFEPEHLGEGELATLSEIRRLLAGDIVKATALAGSGHPGGSLSSLDALILLYANIRHRPDDPVWPERDRVVISIGHIAAGAYAVLARFGYFPIEDLFMGFRRAGTPFSGHVETCVPGIYWNTGNLGQGLSVGTAAALAGKLRGKDYRTIVLMGDGEQQKGQIGEARRFAVKFGLNRLVAVIDRNRLQIGGRTDEVMPQDIAASWRADGWNVIEVADGNDLASLYLALRRAYRGEVERPDRPVAVVAETVMGKGVPLMEGVVSFHGTAPSLEQAATALRDLGLPDDLDVLATRRRALPPGGMGPRHAPPVPWPALDPGEPITYPPDARTDNRTAYGTALADLARRNNRPGAPVILGMTCDLEGSVKMNLLRKACPEAVFECGIQEHHTAVLAGALAREGFVAFFSTFGVFGIAESYNQHRLSDINGAAPKIVLTHCGLDVGEDGPTHHCIDYLGLASNLFGLEVFHPADPNQTDRMVRVLAARPAPSLVCMGRSPTPIIAGEDGSPVFAGDYRFEVGKADVVRRGRDLTFLTYGPLLWRCLQAAAHLHQEHGLSVRVLNFGTLRPIDVGAVVAAATETAALLTVEDHNVHTGLGAAVAGILADRRIPALLRRLGVRRYGSSGSPEELYREQGLDAASIVAEALLVAEEAGLLRLATRRFETGSADVPPA